MTSDIDTRPAFPQLDINACERDGHGDLIEPFTTAAGGLTVREHAAIQLRIPDSGDPALDAMIKAAVRRDLAAQAMQGILAGRYTYSDRESQARGAIGQADALLAELEKSR